MEELLNKISKAPLAAKVGVLVGTIAALTALNYFVIGIPLFGDSISDVETKIEKVQKDMDRDYYMTADEAKDYGIIDRVIEHR